MERAAKAGIWESEAWEINERGRSGTVFRLPLAFLKWFLMRFSLCSWCGKLMEVGCSFISLTFSPAYCCLTPTGFQGICSPLFRLPHSFHQIHSHFQLLPHTLLTWPATLYLTALTSPCLLYLEYQSGEERVNHWAELLFKCRNPVVGYLVLFFLPKFLSWMSFPTEIQTLIGTPLLPFHPFGF